ncbi:MAG: MFS transporter [Candidatus Bathyarchaeia archaeon]
MTSLSPNIRVIFIAGLLSSFIMGVFELLFPLYLQHRGVSLVDMGLIFSASTLAISFSGIFLGEYADVYGRKRVYLSSCALSAVSKSLLPLSSARLEILVNKFLHDFQESLRGSVHNIMLYENARQAYAKLLSWFTASNFVLQAAGSLSFAVLLEYLGYSGSFLLLAGVEVAKLTAVLSYRERREKRAGRRLSLREAYSFRVHRDLKVLALCSAISGLGFGIAHGFLLPLYLVGKYGLDTAQMGLVTALHRLSFLTTPLADGVIRRLGTRRTYMLSTSAYAVSFLAVGFITFPIAVFVPIFLVHDLLGGGIGMTAMSVIVQAHTVDSRRGREINTFNALQTPVGIVAPVIAGILAAANWDLIFIAGGSLYAVSLLLFSLLFKEGGETPSPTITG